MSIHLAILLYSAIGALACVTVLLVKNLRRESNYENDFIVYEGKRYGVVLARKKQRPE